MPSLLIYTRSTHRTALRKSPHDPGNPTAIPHRPGSRSRDQSQDDLAIFIFFLSGDRSWGESQNMLGSIPGFAGLSWDRSWDQLTSILPACLPRCQPQRAALWSAPCYLDCRTHTVRLFQSSYNYLAYKPPSLPLSPSSMRPPCSLIRGCPASRRAPVPASSCGCPNWCPTSSEVKALVK